MFGTCGGVGRREGVQVIFISLRLFAWEKRGKGLKDRGREDSWIDGWEAAGGALYRAILNNTQRHHWLIQLFNPYRPNPA